MEGWEKFNMLRVWGLWESKNLNILILAAIFGLNRKDLNAPELLVHCKPRSWMCRTRSWLKYSHGELERIITPRRIKGQEFEYISNLGIMRKGMNTRKIEGRLEERTKRPRDLAARNRVLNGNSFCDYEMEFNVPRYLEQMWSDMSVQRFLEHLESPVCASHWTDPLHFYFIKLTMTKWRKKVVVQFIQQQALAKVLSDAREGYTRALTNFGW